MISSAFPAFALKIPKPSSWNHLGRIPALYFSHDSKYLSYKQYRKVAMIGINRPEKRNALDSGTVKDLGNLIHELEQDDDVLVGVVYGEGGNFCSGFDLNEVADTSEVPDNFLLNDFTERYIEKPLIAAVNGFAVGFGFDLALFCDLRIMDETAIFGCYGRRFGSSMSEAGIGRLQAMVGFSRAMDLVMTGKSLRSDEALQWGLVNRVASCGTAVGQALTYGMDITKFPKAGVLADRAVLYKHAFSKIRLKNSVIDHDAEQYKEQVLKDVKEGAKLFTSGTGRSGKLFSQQLWNNKSENSLRNVRFNNVIDVHPV